MINGIAVIDKPSGMTSHDVVAIVRRKLRQKRVGHAGTLDPLATGILIILVGQATKMFDRFVAFDKAYQSTMKLGVRTVSADIQGAVISERPWEGVRREDLDVILPRFTGEIEQVPPMVSAVKHKGKRLYKLARQGIEVVREPRKIRVDVLQVTSFVPPLVGLYLECSKGTYVRQVAEDLGEALGCGACITEIRRTKVGPFTLAQAVKLEDFNENSVRDWPAC